MDSLWSNIFRRSDDESVHALLRDIPLFADLSRRELSAIEDILHRREYERDEVLFRQGNPGVGMYIIQEGRIEIMYEPTQDTLAELEDGDFFGELALLNDTPRSASAVAREPSVLFGLFRPDLLGLFDRSPSLGIQILLRMSRVISERLIQSNDQVQRLRTRLEDAGLEDADGAGPAPSAGTDPSGAPSSGAPSNGADSNGADSNGADSNGADSGGADSGGADSGGSNGVGAPEDALESDAGRSFC
jgi:CRP-like cAMP-binding protein